MANNSLTGCIPLCFGNMSSLELLDLSNNHMSCELFEHNLPAVDSSFWHLKLSNNNFKGLLPPSVFNMTGLLYLFLDGNKFVGEVPGTISSFQVVDISNNLLTGMLPRGIGNSSIYPMEGIDLSRNHFEGTIPIEYFNSHRIQFVDLSENNLSGHVGGAYATEVKKLAATILELICEGLGLESGYFGADLGFCLLKFMLMLPIQETRLSSTNTGAASPLSFYCYSPYCVNNVQPPASIISSKLSYTPVSYV
ncbi:hypothetical protein OIU77_018410 [Salix suchowensis]|uniref:Uncharacterized protein n=1 Tax=Salix suchowensis TaxID=1278906 RepID=A0ABQ9CFP9_9ROSI|nr:hypothetical protein OIU77_018410 [Salix suchowensis]